MGKNREAIPFDKPIEVNEFLPTDPLCPVRIMNMYYDKVKSYNVKNLLVDPGTGVTVTENHLSDYCSSFGARCGFENAEWLKFHGNRKQGITEAAKKATTIIERKNVMNRARHGHEHSINRYLKPDKVNVDFFHGEEVVEKEVQEKEEVEKKKGNEIELNTLKADLKNHTRRQMIKLRI